MSIAWKASCEARPDLPAIGTTSSAWTRPGSPGQLSRIATLANAVADHKSKFFPARDDRSIPIDYHAAVDGHLTLVPRGEARAQLKGDYLAMIDAGYLEDDAEDFDVLMTRCGDLQDRVNAAA